MEETPAPQGQNLDKRVVFCLPGQTYSREFLMSWSALMSECMARGVTPILSQQYDAVVHFARAKCLGGNVVKGPSQKPFQGKIEYDYLMWVDSDVVFNAADFFKLLESPHDVTAGLYMMADREHYPVVRAYDNDYFVANGTYQYLTQADVDAETSRYVQAAFAGMGWMLVKKGVVEAMEYPWFFADVREIAPTTGEVLRDMCSEDVAFCANLAKAGVQVHVDKTVRVGHQKTFII